MNESVRVAYPDDYPAIADMMQLALAEKVDARGGAMLIASDLFGSLTRDEIVAVLPELVAQTANLTLIVGTIDEVPVARSCSTTTPRSLELTTSLCSNKHAVWGSVSNYSTKSRPKRGLMGMLDWTPRRCLAIATPRISSRRLV